MSVKSEIGILPNGQRYYISASSVGVTPTGGSEIQVSPTGDRYYVTDTDIGITAPVPDSGNASEIQIDPATNQRYIVTDVGIGVTAPIPISGAASEIQVDDSGRRYWVTSDGLGIDNSQGTYSAVKPEILIDDSNRRYHVFNGGLGGIIRGWTDGINCTGGGDVIVQFPEDISYTDQTGISIYTGDGLPVWNYVFTGNDYISIPVTVPAAEGRLEVTIQQSELDGTNQTVYEGAVSSLRMRATDTVYKYRSFQLDAVEINQISVPSINEVICIHGWDVTGGESTIGNDATDILTAGTHEVDDQANILIGAQPGIINGFKGVIKELKLYNTKGVDTGNLIGYWKINNNSTAITDSSGYNNHGTLTQGSGGWVNIGGTGKVLTIGTPIHSPANTVNYGSDWSEPLASGDAVYFDMGNGHNYGYLAADVTYELQMNGDSIINIPTFDLPTGAAGRIEFDIILDSDASTNRVFSSDSNITNTLFNIVNEVRLQISGTGTNLPSWAIDTQYHVIETWDGNGNGEVFLNGTTLGTVNVTKAAAETGFNIGAETTLTDGTKGIIKNMQVYDAQTAGTLVGEWKIDDNSTTITDTSGNGNDGTLIEGSSQWNPVGTTTPVEEKVITLKTCPIFVEGSIYSGTKAVIATWLTEAQATGVNAIRVSGGTIDVDIGFGDTQALSEATQVTVLQGTTVIIDVTGVKISWKSTDGISTGFVDIEQSAKV